ncbi:ABC transporter ATP-binding protein [Undibacterium sp.]|uniref:ABC transporter ATP-binding protein n=1 Tax=Undibacterium sp. TaxID=1914977 RepID=UPI003750C300
MSEFAIQMTNVSKCFDQHQVLKNLNLAVPYKSIFAFLGNNGEGKSTAIRLIVGLLKPDKGSIQVLGRHVNVERQLILREIGCLVEAPSAYPNLTAYEFLKIACSIKGLPLSEISRVLELVGLQVEQRRLIRHFSLGMKQRLALAHALIGRPKLLILDEPTNGLDPSGIQEIRQLISHLPQQAECTVFVSSHQLDEVEKMASHLALLKDGELQFQSRLDDIYANQSGVLALEVDDAVSAANMLDRHAFQSQVINPNQLIVTHISKELVHQVNACVVRADLRLHSSRFEKPSLEQWFLQQTQRGPT